MITESNLLIRIEKFCLAADISPTTFGVKCMNDPNFVGNLHDGREVRTKTRARVEKFLTLDPKKPLPRRKKPHD